MHMLIETLSSFYLYAMNLMNIQLFLICSASSSRIIILLIHGGFLLWYFFNNSCFLLFYSTCTIGGFHSPGSSYSHLILANIVEDISLWHLCGSCIDWSYLFATKSNIKIPTATDMGDFRPISCVNLIYKLLTMILADRWLRYQENSSPPI